MSTRKVILLDPSDNENIKEIALLGKAYDADDTSIIDFISKNRYLEASEYAKMKKDSNEIEEIICLKEDNKIKDYCHINGEKDRKIGTITFPIIGLKRKNFIPMIINCTQELGLKEVFVKTSLEDKNLIKDLDDLGFESLGEEDGIIIYLKEEELEKNTQRTI